MRSYMTLLIGAVAALAAAPAEKPPTDDKDLPTWVDARVKERQLSEADRKFDTVGWARTVLDAQKLAKEHNRPVFLFTHDGRMNLGRC